MITTFFPKFFKSYKISSILLSSLLTSFSFSYPQPSYPVEEDSVQLSSSSNIQSSDPVSSSNSQESFPYILGPGDSLLVEILDVPEYSGIFAIGPDGTIYLPRLRSLYVEGLTVDELRYFLTQQYSNYVRDPIVYINPAVFRPIRVYVSGEVARPGFYYLSGLNSVISAQNDGSLGSTGQSILDSSSSTNIGSTIVPTKPSIPLGGVSTNNNFTSVTLFDALRNAGGVTAFSNLSDVVVTRKRPISSGGGRVKASLDFMKLLNTGDESQNIRLFDGDTVTVTRSSIELRDQIIKAGQSNLSPDYIQVFVNGRVREPGLKVLPQGVSLDQAIASAGGQKLIRGLVEFVRFNRDGTTDKRRFFLAGDNPAGSFKNPVLMSGDVVRVNDSPLSATLTVLDELTKPAIGVYSIYSIFNDFN